MNTIAKPIVWACSHFRYPSSQQDTVFILRRVCKSFRLTLCAVSIAAFCSVESQGQSFPFWDNLPDTPQPIGYGQGAGYQQDLYIASGSTLVRWNKCAGWTTVACFNSDEEVGAVCLAIQGNSLYVAGQFESISYANCNATIDATNIARYDLNTGQWSVLGANNADWPGCPIKSIVADALGNVYVGLWFGLDIDTNYYASPHGIMKWDGTNWSGLGGGLLANDPTGEGCLGEWDSVVAALATDGTNIFAAGGFFGGINPDGSTTNSHCIIEWKPITAQWASMGDSTGLNNYGCDGFTLEALSLAVCGTNLFVAGGFTHPSFGIAQYSTLSGEALPGDGLNDNGNYGDYVRGFSLVSHNGIVYVTGDFNMAGDVSANGIAQWNSTNGTWTNMASGLGGPWPWANYLAANDNVIFVEGSFSSAGDVPMTNNDPSIARWVTSPDTCDVDDSFNPSTDQGVLCAALQSDGKILIGGDFSYVNGQFCPGVARLNTDGTLDTTFNATSVISNYFGDDLYYYSDVYCLAVDWNGGIYVGGDSYDWTTNGWAGILVRLDTYGNLDTSFPTIQVFTPGDENGDDGGAFYTLTSFRGDPSWQSELFATGSFTTWPGFPSSYALGGLVLDFWYTGRGIEAGSLDNGPPGPLVVNGVVNAALFQSSGYFVVGGYFSEIGGQPFTNVGVTGGGGGTWGADEPVYALALQPDGKILAAGIFGELGSDTCCQIGRFNSDGTTDETFNANASGSGCDLNYATSLLLQPNGKIIYGGVAGGGEPLGRLNSDGSNDSSFTIQVLVNGEINGSANQLLSFPDGRVLVVGQFDNVGGQNHTNIARICPQ